MAEVTPAAPPPFCDAICLFEFRGSFACYPAEYAPSGFDFFGRLDVITASIFPSAKQKKPQSFAFNIDSEYCYCLAFECHCATFCVLLVSKFPYPSLFLSFLDEGIEQLSSFKSESPERELYHYLWTLLKSWRSLKKSTFEVSFPSITRPIEVDLRLKAFLDFNPFELLSPNTDFISLWKAVLTGGGVLIVSDSPSLLCRAAFSVMSLSSPFPFRDSFLISLDPNDPRLKGDTSKYFIVATTSKSLPQSIRSFASVVEVPMHASKPNESAFEEWGERSEVLFRMMTLLNEMSVESDPYNNFIGRSAVETHYLSHVSAEAAVRSLSFEEARKFEKSETMRKWRKDITFTASFRDSFLCIPPCEIFTGKCKSELEKYKECIDELREGFKGDEHLLSILKAHKRFIEEMLRK